MIKKIDEIIAGAATVGITGHVRPDGDCVGSTLGLYNYIIDNYPEINVTVYLEKFEEHFKFINGSDKVVHDLDTAVRHDVFIVLDCGDLNRIANFVRHTFEAADKTVCIDHHTCNLSFADVNHVIAGMSSTCEVLYELLDADKVGKNTAEALYTGIIHDTGVLKYRSTTKRTMEIAGNLMDMGIDYTAIIDDTFYRKTFIQNQLLGIALINSELLNNGKIISSFMPLSTMQKYGATGTDMGGIIDQLRFTEGIEIAVFLYELPDGSKKGSLRSVNNIDVNVIANCFGGGGHVRAAGFTSNLKPEEILDIIVLEFNKQCITE